MIQLTGFFWILLAGAIFGVIHSGLASNRVKNFAVLLLGEKIRSTYRFFYVVIAFVTTLAYLSLIVLLPNRLIYEIPAPWVYLTLLLQIAALAGFGVGLSQIGTADFLGLGGLRHSKDSSQEALPPQLVTHKLYHWVRHPVYTCLIGFLWLSPHMSWNFLALAIGMTLYTIIGAKLEENKMIESFGSNYAEYRKHTPMFLSIHLK